MIENRIKHYLELLDVSMSEVAAYMNVSYQSIVSDMKRSNFTIKKALDYIELLERISYEKSDGKQMLQLKLDDLFFIK